MDKKLILAQFSRKKRLAVSGYERFVKERAGQGHMKESYELKDQRLLGEDDFVEAVVWAHWAEGLLDLWEEN